jgi:hypothetical protein
MNELAKKTPIDAIETALLGGDLSKLTAEERGNYYNSVCTSLQLNPLTRPFEYITLNGKLTLYARRDCTDQLRKRDKISIKIVAREHIGDIFMVTAQAINAEGRTDESIGAVNIAGLKGEGLANAYMKCETKAKRRVALSICGLGMLDENEVETVPQAKIVHPDAPKPLETHPEATKEALVEPHPIMKEKPAFIKPTKLKSESETNTIVTCCECGQVLEDPFAIRCGVCSKEFRRKHNIVIVKTIEEMYGVPSSAEGKSQRLKLYRAYTQRPIDALKEASEEEMSGMIDWLKDNPELIMKILNSK